ncbi:MAG TPA: CO dehydrogenase/acetyl-CoA synthase subunit delta, partial [Methanocella sp.]
MAERNMPTGAGKSGNALEQIIALLSSVDRVELENFTMEVGNLELFIPAGGALPGAVPRPLMPG